MNTEVTDVTADRMAGAYVKMRDKRAELKKEFEETDNALKAKMETLEQAMLKTCTDLKADSIKTKHGTIIRGIKSRYWTSDWDSMKKFIKENDAIDLLENRIAQKNMGQFLEEHPNDMPPGLNIDRKYAITVRRAG